MFVAPPRLSSLDRPNPIEIEASRPDVSQKVSPLQGFGGFLLRLLPNPCVAAWFEPRALVFGPTGLRIAFGTGLGGGVLVSGLSCPDISDNPKIRSLASWYFVSRSARVWGTGEGEAEEVFEGVVVGVGRLRILSGAWMTVCGGGETTVAEVDDLEITSCGIGVFEFLTRVPISS